MGAAVVGLVVGTILMDTTRYFDYFSDTDKKWVQRRCSFRLVSLIARHPSLSSPPHDSFADYNSGQLIICCVQVSFLLLLLNGTAGRRMLIRCSRRRVSWSITHLSTFTPSATLMASSAISPTSWVPVSTLPRPRTTPTELLRLVLYSLYPSESVHADTLQMSGRRWWLGVGLMVFNTATLVMGST